MSQKYLEKEDCIALWNKYGTPEHVRRHCQAVADVAVKLTRELNKYGLSLDEKLVYGAAMIHDIARVEDNHGEVGAKIAALHGYFREAEIIKVHMRYDMHLEIKDLNETDMVCFGDRVVKEDKYVGLEERMDYVASKVINNPIAVSRINATRKETKGLQTKIEALIGMSMDELMGER